MLKIDVLSRHGLLFTGHRQKGFGIISKSLGVFRTNDSELLPEVFNYTCPWQWLQRWSETVTLLCGFQSHRWHFFFQYEAAFSSWRCAGSHFQERLVWYCLLSRQHHNDWKRHHAANILGERVWVNNGNIPCIILQTKRNQVQKVKRLEGCDHMKE